MDNVDVKSVGNGKAVIGLNGRLDVTLAAQIEEELNEFIAKESVKHLILDLNEVEYMSSSGFRVAIAILRKLKDDDGSLKFCSLKPSVKRLFDVIELTSLFEIYESVEDATASWP
jgi:stage II sporulation protein AA (anti-sigma F factor antagonist)|tara:strand:+ start:20 stop:364 length:345 start_codon:yes stop_codon:yes gene_type:complete